jgi:hypothetical protein
MRFLMYGIYILRILIIQALYIIRYDPGSEKVKLKKEIHVIFIPQFSE